MPVRVPFQPPILPHNGLAFLGEAPGDKEVNRTGNYVEVARAVWPGYPWTGDPVEDWRLTRKLKLPPLPLTGSSGRTFNAMLKMANVDRTRSWVGNVFEEKAPGNDETVFLQDPEKREAAFARLAEELADFGPTVIVPMGGTALQALTGLTRISRMRGSPLVASRVAPEVKLVPTLHPAAIMRDWKMLQFAVADIEKAVQEAARGPELVFPERRFYLDPTLEDLEEWGPYLDRSGLLSVDIETGWGMITMISFSPNSEESLVVPFVDRRQPSRSYWPTIEAELHAWQWVKARMEGPAPKVGQYFANYDAYWLLHEAGIRTFNLRDDTRLMSHAHLPEAGKSLAELAATWSDQPAWKQWVEHHKTDKRDD